MKGERRVAGLLCSEVLAELSDYMDGSLDVARVAAIEAHVRGCSVCEAFGGAFGRAIGALRRRLRAEDASSEVLERLVKRTLES